jgi:DNA-binding NtrC family response regulator
MPELGANPLAPGDAGSLGALMRGLRGDGAAGVAPRQALEDGLRIAESRADLASQAMLHAALAAHWLATGQGDLARKAHASAQEIADSVPGPARTAAYLRTVSDLLAHGRVRDGISAFERLLGDVPDELVELGTTDVSYGAREPSLLPLLLARGYAGLGQDGRALDLLHRHRIQAERSGQPSQEATARIFLAWFLAYRGNRAAQWHADLAWDYFAGHVEHAHEVWLASVVQVWAAAANGRMAQLGNILRVGLEARERAGESPFCGALLFDLDRHLDVGQLRDAHGLDLVEEANRAILSTDALTAASAHLFLARRARADCQGVGSVAEHLGSAVACLLEAGSSDSAESAGDPPPSVERMGEAAGTDRWRASTPGRWADDGLDNASADVRGHRLVDAVVGLASLPWTMREVEGCWGAIAARLSDVFAMERVALLETGGVPVLLGVRGGDSAWRRDILREASTTPAAPRCVGACDGGQRIVVPFTSSVGRGVVVMENCYAAPRVGPTDMLVLDLLGAQLGIVAEGLARAHEPRTQPSDRSEDRSPALQPGDASPASPVDATGTMRSLLHRCLHESASPAVVIVRGEPGVGKQTLARAIHQRSEHARGPFVVVRTAGLSALEVARALFGYERGAFVGADTAGPGAIERACGGTLFLDDVCDLAPSDQARLVRLLRHRTFERCAGTRVRHCKARLVLASARDLDDEARAGRLRAEILSIPEVVTVAIPPLRERIQEIPSLARAMLAHHLRRTGRDCDDLSVADVQRLQAYAWPGNLRELDNVVERAVLASSGPQLRIPSLLSTAGPDQDGPGQVPMSLEEVERRHIAEVLWHTCGKITGRDGAAAILKLNPSTLNWRIGKLGLREVRAQARARGPRRRTGKARGNG